MDINNKDNPTEKTIIRNMFLRQEVKFVESENCIDLEDQGIRLIFRKFRFDSIENYY